MAVKLRMTRMGRRHRPFFRINAIESREPRDGRILENLGHYDPIEKDPTKQLKINLERAKYWLDNGAIPSDSVSQILLRQGLKHKYAEEKTLRLAKAKAVARAKGKPFNEAERIAIEKAAKAVEEKAKIEAEEKVKAEAEAKAKAAQEEKAKADAEAAKEAEVKEETPEEKTDTESKSNED